MEIRPVNYDEYIGAYQDDMIQRFSDGTLTDIEDVRKFVYGYATTPMYLEEGEECDETLPRWWTENSNNTDFHVQDDYVVPTLQEKLIIDALKSTGDGLTKETAIYVTEIEQEYDYMDRVYPDIIRLRKRQTLVSDDEHEYDMFIFRDNPRGIKELWFECSRIILREEKMSEKWIREKELNKIKNE